MSRVWLYGRHSTVHQSMTEAAQRERCEQFFKRELEPLGYVCVGWFYDRAQSGGTPFSEREQGRLVTAGAAPGDRIVCAKLDRAFRSISDGVNLIKMLALRDVEFVFCDVLISGSPSMVKFFRNILLAIGELERDVTSERTKEVKAYRRSKGLPYCSSCPIGWKKVTVTRGVDKPEAEYRVDEAERQLVTRMASLRGQGWTQERIALWCIRQQELPAKRKFSDRTTVRWALMARDKGYPKLCNYKEMRRLVASGEI